jgi:hypothetical protein
MLLAAVVGFVAANFRLEMGQWVEVAAAPDKRSTESPPAAEALAPRAAEATTATVAVDRGPVSSGALVLGSAPGFLSRDEQQYADRLWPIHTLVEQTLASVGLGTAMYMSAEIDDAELRMRLDEGLSTFRAAETRLRALDPPPTLRPAHEDYLTAVGLFEESTQEMLRLYDDGDRDHLARALPATLDGVGKLRRVSAELWPETEPLG